MTIAVCSAPFLTNTRYNLVYEAILERAAACPQHQYIFIGPPYISVRKAPANIRFEVSQPLVNYGFFWLFWLRVTLPGIVRKLKPDVLLHLNGTSLLTSRLPQYVLISDLSFLHLPMLFSGKQVSFMKRNLPAFLHKATCVLATSPSVRNDLQQQCGLPAEKVILVEFKAPGDFRAIDWEDKERVKSTYTDGKEYFLFRGETEPVNEVVNLLKAFSFFKTRQKSNMQLVLLTQAGPASEDLLQRLRTYKWRKEVILLPGQSSTVVEQLTAAAYAFVQPSQYDGSGMFVMQAMVSRVPVITGQNGMFGQPMPPVVLPVDPSNHEDIAQKMMLLFKDEGFRAELIEQAEHWMTERRAPDFCTLFTE